MMCGEVMWRSMPFRQGVSGAKKCSVVMKFSIVISAYQMADFVALNLAMCKQIFPDCPVLVSDDRSPNSEAIEAVASQYGAAYICTRIRKHHFAGDLQSIINGLVFAKANGCDAMIKCSLRFIIIDKSIRDLFEDRMTNHITDLIAPSKCKPGQIIRRESITFSLLPILTDCLVLKTDSISPEDLISHYRQKCSDSRVPHGTLIEALFMDLCHGEFKTSHHIEDAISVHQPGQPHRFLRKAQNNRLEYLDHARKLGIVGDFKTDEWNKILGVHYQPKPRAI